MQKLAASQNSVQEVDGKVRETVAPVEQAQAVEIENEIEFTVLDTSFTFGESRAE